jgi:tetratricopeptide (TPR) repeat protein
MRKIRTLKITKLLAYILTGAFLIYLSANEISYSQPLSLKDFIQEGKILYQEGNYELSIEKLEKAEDYLRTINLKAKSEKLAEIYFYQGSNFAQQANIELAKVLFKRALQKCPDRKYDLSILNDPIKELFLDARLEIEKEFSPQAIGMPGKEKGKAGSKTWIILAVVGVIAVGVLAYFLLKGKKKDYTLTVNKGDGANGTPDSGTYTYKEGSVVNYNYTLQKGYKDLMVKLNGHPVPANGSITMIENYSLEASASKLGKITSVTIRFELTFAATNLKTKHNIKVGGQTMIDETFNFNVPGSDKWNDAKKITRTFTFARRLGTFRIRHEVGPEYSRFYGGQCYWIWATHYQLSVKNYTYGGGADPGNPTLSDNNFYIQVAPWRNDPNDAWYRIKTQEITIRPPSRSTLQKETEIVPKKPEVCSSDNRF